MWQIKRVGIVVSLVTMAVVASRLRGDEADDKFEQQLVLSVEGKDVRLPLEKLDVYLVEDEKEHPEIFEMIGPDVTLVGAFPMNIHVDYDENWERMLNRPIKIAPKGGDPREEKESTLALPGQERAAVIDGTFTVTKIGEGADAKTPLSGTIKLKVKFPGGMKTLEGRFAVLGTTWG